MGKIVTSYGISKMTGKVGDAVFSIEEGGTGMRSYNAISKQPFTDAQLTREAAFRKANQVWTTIGFDAASAWRAYGAKQKVRTITGATRKRQGKDCFVGLYAKTLQLNPAAAVPTPPVGTYAGDTVTLSALLVTGGAQVFASAANAAGTTTEILFQELPSAVALPTPGGYRTAAFKAFTGTDLSLDLTLAPGFYELAYRFVETATGRTADMTPFRRAVVGLSMVEGGAEEAATEVKKAA